MCRGQLKKVLGRGPALLSPSSEKLNWSDPPRIRWQRKWGRSSPVQCFSRVQGNASHHLHPHRIPQVTFTAEVNAKVNASVNRAFRPSFTQNATGIARHCSLYLSIQCLEKNLCRKKAKIIGTSPFFLGRKPLAFHMCNDSFERRTRKSIRLRSISGKGGSDPDNFLGGPRPKKWGRSRPFPLFELRCFPSSAVLKLLRRWLKEWIV
jgi:hypothetical protein